MNRGIGRTIQISHLKWYYRRFLNPTVAHEASTVLNKSYKIIQDIKNRLADKFRIDTEVKIAAG
jgi:hypothetical protein